MIIPTCSSAARRTTSSASWPSAPQRAPVRLSQRATAPPCDGPARRRRPSAPASASGRPARPDACPPSRSREPGQLQVGQAAEVDRGGPGVAVRDHRPGGQHHLSSGAWRARAVGLAMDMTSTTTSTACHCQVIQRSPDGGIRRPAPASGPTPELVPAIRRASFMGLMPARQGTDAILSATEKDSG